SLWHCPAVNPSVAVVVLRPPASRSARETTNSIEWSGSRRSLPESALDRSGPVSCQTSLWLRNECFARTDRAPAEYFGGPRYLMLKMEKKQDENGKLVRAKGTARDVYQDMSVAEAREIVYRIPGEPRLYNTILPRHFAGAVLGETIDLDPDLPAFEEWSFVL